MTYLTNSAKHSACRESPVQDQEAASQDLSPAQSPGQPEAVTPAQPTATSPQTPIQVKPTKLDKPLLTPAGKSSSASNQRHNTDQACQYMTMSAGIRASPTVQEEARPQTPTQATSQKDARDVPCQPILLHKSAILMAKKANKILVSKLRPTQTAKR